MTRVEFRTRSRHAPREIRIHVGTASGSRELRRLDALRARLKDIAKRREWAVLEGIESGAATVEQVDALVEEHGWAGYRAHLSLTPTRNVPTLAEHVERWLPDIAKDQTRRVYSDHIKRLLRFEVDGQPLASRPWHAIYEHEVRDAVAGLRENLARNTARTCLGAWGAFFTWAIEREESEARAEKREPLIEASPIRRARRWGKPRITRHRFFSGTEYHDLLGATIRPMAAQYAALTFTGLRITEFMVLPPHHVKDRVISVGPWGEWAPKNERGVRDIPIHATELAPLLEEYRAEWAGDRSFFVNPNTGDPWTYAAFSRRMRADVQAIGVTYGQRKGGVVQPDGVTPHTFRHTLATWLCQNDVQLMKIAAILGDTVEVVAAHYAHHLPTDLDQAVNQLAAPTVP